MRLRRAGGTLPIGGVPPTLLWLYVMRQLQHEAVSRFFETRLACLCVLLGGPSYAAGAESLFIAGDTYREPGVSGPGWTWTDADHLELTGYAGEAIGADGELVVTLVGQNSVVETHAPDADISMSGMEVWGNLSLRGSGSLTATGSQCGIHVSQALLARPWPALPQVA